MSMIRRASLSEFCCVSSQKSVAGRGKNLLRDEVAENIRQIAREDAGNGVYMSDRFGAYRLSTINQYVSPNRSGLMAMFSPMIASARYTDGQPVFFRIQGFGAPYTAKFFVGAMFGAHLSVYDENGDEILSYSPPPDGIC